MGKVLLSINFTKVTYNGEISHCSMNLVLGSSSTVHQPLPLVLLFFSSHKMVANLGARGIQKRAEFLCYYFLLFKWDPYLFFYRLKEGSYPVE
jgi:hypothetical protein